jgi:hypothetical protein
MVGSAAAAEDGEGGERSAELGLGRGQCADVTFIEVLGVVEVGVTPE